MRIMYAEYGLLAWLIALIWFLAYWILGGVFFSVMAVLRLGSVRKVRFSCLFTILALGCAFGASLGGIRLAGDSIDACLVESASHAEAITAIFGCGFVGIFGAFFLGLVVLVAVGAILLMLSTTKSKPWIVLEEREERKKR